MPHIASVYGLDMPQSHSVTPEFSIASARNHIRDLFRPRAWIYWTDFLASYLVGVYCFRQVRGSSIVEPHQGFQGNFHQTFFFIASCLLFYRAGMFIHEVVHQRTSGNLRSFRFVWNVLCGIPFLIPSFVYFTHIDHHRRAHYGTDRDGEYIPLQHQQRWRILFYLSWSFVIPILVIIRFLVCTPLAWVIPGFREFVHKHASSMVMDPSYIRPLPTKQVLRIIQLQELCCFLWCLGIAVIPPVFWGRWPIPFVVQAYLMGVSITLLNAIRTLGSHRWQNKGGERTFAQQLLDSVNYPHRPWFSELWGPVGTRYHALHHVFPSLPYHALPVAHRRLMQELPADSAYRRTEAKSLTAALRDLWRDDRNDVTKERPRQLSSAAR